MKLPLICSALAALVPATAAWACPPPPPGYVPPTHEQLLERSLSDDTEIVYGIVTGNSPTGDLTQFKIYHVYKGTMKKGATIEAQPGWGHPEPFCVGMMSPAAARPVGTYGVIAFRKSAPQIDFIKPEDVQIMIRKGWIRSARARS